MPAIKPRQPVPGTTIFDGEQARKGYALNKMCYSFNDAANRAAFVADEELGRRADNVGSFFAFFGLCARFSAIEAEEIHIWRGINDAEGAVYGEGVDAGFEVEALGENDLEDVAGGDVVFGLFDGFEEGGLAGLGLEAQFAAGFR